MYTFSKVHDYVCNKLKLCLVDQLTKDKELNFQQHVSEQGIISKPNLKNAAEFFYLFCLDGDCRNFNSSTPRHIDFK